MTCLSNMRLPLLSSCTRPGDEDLTAARAEQKRAMDAASELTGAPSRKGVGKEGIDISLPGGSTLGAGGAKEKTAGIVVSGEQGHVPVSPRLRSYVLTLGAGWEIVMRMRCVLVLMMRPRRCRTSWELVLRASVGRLSDRRSTQRLELLHLDDALVPLSAKAFENTPRQQVRHCAGACPLLCRWCLHAQFEWQHQDRTLIATGKQWYYRSEAAIQKQWQRTTCQTTVKRLWKSSTAVRTCCTYVWLRSKWIMVHAWWRS